jgi:Tol biopolymer transport system component/DNA-binding winged helix-turn-helix (wHTH) protein
MPAAAMDAEVGGMLRSAGLRAWGVAACFPPDDLPMRADDFPTNDRPGRLSHVVLINEADFTLGGLLVRPSRCEVTVGGRTEKIEPRVMEVFVALVRAGGAAVSRAELLESCWGGRAVSDDAVERCIGRLRKLAESAASAFTIETLPRIGYRLSRAGEPDGPAAEKVQAAGLYQFRRSIWIVVISFAAAAFGVALFATGRHGQWTIVESKPLIATLLVERWPAISPDGRTIAYSVGTDIFARKIYLKRIEGGAPVRLTDDVHDDTSPAWSSDGKRIAYVAFQAGEPCRIMVIAASGGRAREVGRCGALERTHVAFAPTDDAVFLVDKTDQKAPQSIMRLNLASGVRSAVSRPPPEISGDTNVVVSPDAKSIAYLRYSDKEHQIMVQDLRTGNVRRVWSDKSWSDGLAWSEDSQSLLLATNRGGDHAVWLVSLDGDPAQRLTSSSLYLGRLSAGPGGQLAAEATVDIQNLVETAGERDGAPVAVFPAHGQTWSPARAPDGTLAMLSNRSGDNGVWVAKGNAPIVIASFGSQFIYHLRWSPDGAMLAFEIRGDDGALRVRIISRTGNDIVSLPAPGSQLDAPTWSDDGKVLVIAAKDSSGWRIWRIDRDRQRRFEPASPYGWRHPQLHGGALYATQTNGPGLWRLENGVPARLVFADLKADQPWAFAGNAIVFVDAPDKEHPQFLRKTLDDAPATVVAAADGYYTDMTGEYGGGFAISPKTGRITYVSKGRADTDIILMRMAHNSF